MLPVVVPTSVHAPGAHAAADPRVVESLFTDADLVATSLSACPISI